MLGKQGKTLKTFLVPWRGAVEIGRFTINRIKNIQNVFWPSFDLDKSID